MIRPMETLPPDAPIEILRRTRPWLRFLGIALLLGFAVTVLIGLAFVGIGIVAGGMLAGDGEAHVGPVLAFLGLLMLPLALVYVYPAILLLRAAGRIPEAGVDSAVAAAADSLELQGKFWRYVGIAALLALAFQALMLGLFAADLLGLLG